MRVIKRKRIVQLQKTWKEKIKRSRLKCKMKEVQLPKKGGPKTFVAVRNTWAKGKDVEAQAGKRKKL